MPDFFPVRFETTSLRIFTAGTDLLSLLSFCADGRLNKKNKKKNKISMRDSDLRSVPDPKELVQETMTDVKVSSASRLVQVSCTSYLSVCQGRHCVCGTRLEFLSHGC